MKAARDAGSLQVLSDPPGHIAIDPKRRHDGRDQQAGGPRPATPSSLPSTRRKSLNDYPLGRYVVDHPPSPRSSRPERSPDRVEAGSGRSASTSSPSGSSHPPLCGIYAGTLVTWSSSWSSIHAALAPVQFRPAVSGRVAAPPRSASSAPDRHFLVNRPRDVTDQRSDAQKDTRDSEGVVFLFDASPARLPSSPAGTSQISMMMARGACSRPSPRSSSAPASPGRATLHGRSSVPGRRRAVGTRRRLWPARGGASLLAEGGRPVAEEQSPTSPRRQVPGRRAGPHPWRRTRRTAGTRSSTSTSRRPVLPDPGIPTTAPGG